MGKAHACITLPDVWRGHIVKGFRMMQQKQKIRQGLALLLAAALAMGMMPSAFAATDNADVLTTLGHADAVEAVSLTAGQRDVTLYVTNSYPGSEIDLSEDLEITYGGSYKYVVAVSSGSAVINGEAVSLSVSYNDIGDDDTAPKGTTVYSVRVVRRARIKPVFGGVIAKSGKYPGTVSFLRTDFDSKFTLNDGPALSSVIITGSNLTTGSLYLGDALYEFGTHIPAAQFDDLSFVTAGTGNVTYYVEGFAGDALEPAGTARLSVTVDTLSPPLLTGSISRTVAAGSELTFSKSAFQSVCNLQGGTLTQVEITPDGSAFGFWSVDGVRFSSARTIPVEAMDSLTFTGSASGTAGFTFRVSNETGFSGYGAGSIAVTAPTLTAIPYTAPDPVMKGSKAALNPSMFTYSPAAAEIRYIKITAVPAAADGALMLSTTLAKNEAAGYPAIQANRALAAGAIIPYAYLRYLYLDTKSTSTSSSISFSFTVTAEPVATAAVWPDSAAFTV